MNGLVKTTEKKEVEAEFSFKYFFIPLTTLKAIHWIIFIGIVVYANVLFNGFVWDDLTFIINNSSIHPLNILYLFGKNSFNNGGYYRPLPAVYFSLLWNLFGNTAFFYHLFQIVLHIASACLLFYFLKRFFDKTLTFFLVIIFLIHPIQVESVAYIGATQSELLFITGLTALMVGIKEKLNQKSVLLMSFFLLLSLLTKETSFLFLIMILLYQLLFHRRRMLSFILYSLGTVLIYVIIRFLYAEVFLVKNISTTLGTLSLSERFINIPAIVFYYIKTFLYPAQLCINQLWIVTSFTIQQFYFPLLADALFFFIVVAGGLYVYKKIRKRFTLYLFFLVWFLIGMGLILQIFPLDMTVAERWFYFPIVGLLGMLGSGIQLVHINNKKIKIAMYLLSIVVLVLLSIRTIVRNTNWIDEQTLYSHDSQIHDNYDLENSLGAQFLNKNNALEALPHLEKSVSLFPFEMNLNNLGTAYEDLGDIQKAKFYYYKTINTNSFLSPSLHKRIVQIANEEIAHILVFHDKPEIAKKFISKAIKNYPNSGDLWLYLAVLDYQANNHVKAKDEIAKAYNYSQSSVIRNYYDLIMNDQPLNIK